MNKVLNRPDSSLFCHDTSLLQGRSFCPSLFLYFFQKPKPLSKRYRAVEAPRSNHSPSCRVVIHLYTICSLRFHLENGGFFLHYTLFLKKYNLHGLMFPCAHDFFDFFQLKLSFSTACYSIWNFWKCEFQTEGHFC